MVLPQPRRYAWQVLALTLSVFDGPLDALLAAVESGDLDAARVPVAAVVLQYLHYRVESGAGAAETAEFVGMAGRLMLLKSRALLPRPPAPPSVEEPAPDLELVLAEYRRFKEAAATLRERQEEGLRSFARLAPPPVLPPGTGLSQVTLDRLVAIVRDVLSRQALAPAGTVEREVVTVREKIAHLDALLTARGRISFIEVISASRSRIEVVVAFMAVLELVRRGRAVAEQSEQFGDIWIAQLPPAPSATPVEVAAEDERRSAAVLV